jgi:hypothetical protein
MDEKDYLGLEVKLFMEQETYDMELTHSIIDNIIRNKKKTLKEQIKDFLNKEIEIPLTPAIIGLAALIVLTLIPRDLFKSQNIRIIDIEGSQVIIRESYEVSKK